MISKKLSSLVFISFFTSPAQAFLEENDLDGLGLEILMGGVGQARIGSHGALGSNPSLLAWLPRKQEFISSNQINFYRLKSLENGDADVSPDVIPRYAASTEGFGKWGHGYGLIINNAKVAFSQEDQDQTISGIQENQGIYFNYSLGYKISEDIALGISLYAARFEEENFFSVLGKEAGNQFVIAVDEKKSLFAQGFSLGAAARYNTWAFGLSTKFTTLTFMAKGQQTQSGYYETSSSTLVTRRDDVPAVDMIPNVRAGVKKEFEDLNLYFDVSWLPEIYSSDMEEHVKSQFSLGLAGEGTFNNRYGWYSGYVHRRGDSGDNDDGTISVGASKKNTHSMNYAGVSWRKEYRGNGNELIQLNFGTMFDY